MILNFIKLTWRHFIRNPFFSLINIVGLTVGITAALLILLLVFHEKSYDNFHEKAENIYRAGLDCHSLKASGNNPVGSLRYE
jgi:putative ABC transport system permease protein